MAVTRFVLSVGTIGFPHVCDPAKFRAWVRYACSARFDPDGPEWTALDPATAEARCAELYGAIVNAFKSANARPFGWAFYRDTWERVSGRLDPSNWAWIGGTWHALATNAWADAGGDLRDLDQSYLLELREDGFDRQRFWINGDGSVTVTPPPPAPSGGLQGSSRELAWSEDDIGLRVRLRIVPTVYAYAKVARAIAAKLSEFASGDAQLQNLIKEIRGDLEAKNFATASGIGLTVLDLPGRAELERRQRVQEDRERAAQVAGTLAGIGAAVAAIPGGQIAGAVIGIIAAVVALLGQFVGLARQWQRDVFYRAEPAFEVFRFNDEIDPALHRFPAGPPGWTEPPPRPGLTEPLVESEAFVDAAWVQRVVPSLDTGEPFLVKISATRAELTDMRVWVGGTLIPAERFEPGAGAGEWRADVRLPPGEWLVSAWARGRRAFVERVTIPETPAVRLRPNDWPVASHPLEPRPRSTGPVPTQTPPPAAQGGGGVKVLVGLGMLGALGALAATVWRREDRRQ